MLHRRRDSEPGGHSVFDDPACAIEKQLCQTGKESIIRSVLRGIEACPKRACYTSDRRLEFFDRAAADEHGGISKRLNEQAVRACYELGSGDFQERRLVAARPLPCSTSRDHSSTGLTQPADRSDQPLAANRSVIKA